MNEFEGVGGNYRIKNGKVEQLEAPTQDHPLGNKPRDAEEVAIETLPAVETKKKGDK